MKRFILLLFLFGCSRQQPNNPDKMHLTEKSNYDLFSLLEKLPTIKKPLTFSSNKQIIGASSPKIDDDLFKEIQTIDPALHPYGKIYETKDFIAVIAIGAGDILIPVLVTFDKNGKIIDSFSMYQTAGEDMGYYSTNIVTLTESRELFLTDSVLTRNINKEGTDEIPGTDSLSVIKKKFRVKDNGKIEEVK